MLSKEISNTFQACSNSKKEELEEQVRKLKEPIDDFKEMVDAAIKACERRRQFVCRYYEHLEQEKKSQ
jgi:hypothetical protein